jgi:RimJ/RimL family protein N-acetyltransferase
MKGETASSLSLRRLMPDDWASYRAIRLAALRECPGVYGMTYADEEKYGEATWRMTLVDNDTYVFGLFDDETLVATQGVSRWRKDPRKGIVWGSYIRPAYRGQGRFGSLYRACLDEAERHADWDSLFVSHRADNEASRRVILANGFTRTHAEPHIWPDGVACDEVCYMLALHAC